MLELRSLHRVENSAGVRFARAHGGGKEENRDPKAEKNANGRKTVAWGRAVSWTGETIFLPPQRKKKKPTVLYQSPSLPPSFLVE